ncbi:MAG: hypothetical protein FWG89_03385 [Treponema sp.]|nr:hypothetical protein [Treponema sp.]
MAGNIVSSRIPFAYRSGKTILHRVPAGLKLLFVIAVSAAAFASVYGLAAAILLIFIFSLAAKIPPRELLKGCRPVLFLSLLIVLVKTVEPGSQGISILGVYIPAVSTAGFISALNTILCILSTFAAAALLFAVTTMRELRLSIAAVELAVKRLFRRRNSVGFFSLGLCLMLGFIPRFFELWETANLACEARSCKHGPRRLLILIPLVTEQMMETAADTALALEARGLSGV